MRHMRRIRIVQAYSIVSNEMILPWFINKIPHWKVDFPTFQSSQGARDIGWQNKISVCGCYCIQLRGVTVQTIGQRSFFFPEIKSHSKSSDMNHSYLRITQQDEERKTRKNAHINTRKRMHKFYQDLIILLNFIREFPVSHWEKLSEMRQRIGGNGGWNYCVRDEEWYLTGPYILYLDFGTVDTMTIIAFKPHLKPPSSPMMYQIQLDHKYHCHEFWCLLPLFVLAQLRSFPQFEIIKCLVDVFHWYIFRACNPFINRLSTRSVDKGGSSVNTSFNETKNFTSRSSRSQGWMAPSVEVSAALVMFLG